MQTASGSGLIDSVLASVNSHDDQSATTPIPLEYHSGQPSRHEPWEYQNPSRLDKILLQLQHSPPYTRLDQESSSWTPMGTKPLQHTRIGLTLVTEWHSATSTAE